MDDTTQGKPPRFAVVILVGPGTLNLWRAIELIRSILYWEPTLGWCVLMDDAPRPRGLSELSIFPQSCQAVTLMNSLAGMRDIRGGQTAGVLKALAWIHSNTTAEFALKIDLDALVIAPFVNAVRSCLARAPEAGEIGVFWSCNPDIRALVDLQREPRLLRAYRLLSGSSSVGESRDTTQAEATLASRTSVAQRRAFDAIGPHIEAAFARGYRTCEDCQGGACVVSRLMIDRMWAAGCLDDPDLWRPLPVGDDQALAMYARAVGLQLHECARPGDPFGVQPAGLPYTPEQLVARGYSLIHSIKNDPRYSEAAIRAFFAHRASSSEALTATNASR